MIWTRALYIISQPKTSKRNADYMKFVMDNTGMTESEAKLAGQEVKKQLHERLKGHTLDKPQIIPRLYNPQDISPIPAIRNSAKSSV